MQNDTSKSLLESTLAENARMKADLRIVAKLAVELPKKLGIEIHSFQQAKLDSIADAMPTLLPILMGPELKVILRECSEQLQAVFERNKHLFEGIVDQPKDNKTYA